MSEAAVPLSQRTLRVSELTRYIRYLIEGDDLLAALSVQGEVANLSRSNSGHVYFTIKDEASQLNCILFRREAMQQSQQVRQLQTGTAVIVHGYLAVYEPKGSFQLYVERVVPQGEGASFQRFTKLKEQLEREGLFAPERKRQLPPFPRQLALITSPGSQAYHDVLHRLQAQYPFVQVIVAGVSVQGPGAAEEMAMAIDIVNRLTDADLILLVRGGGAPEELAAFNEERLARAMFGSRLPIVTGIGHETDYTIADFVADRRAATPSLAAATSVPDARALVRETGRLHAQLSQAMHQRFRFERKRWLEVNRALVQASPRNRLQTQRQRADVLARGANRAIDVALKAKRGRLAALHAQLLALDPLAILRRGYAVITKVDGGVVSSVAEVQPGDRLEARVSDGTIPVRVEVP